MLHFCNNARSEMSGIPPMAFFKYLFLLYFAWAIPQGQMGRSKARKRHTIGGTGHIIKPGLAAEGD
jgi:hypothetical protein